MRSSASGTSAVSKYNLETRGNTARVDRPWRAHLASYGWPGRKPAMRGRVTLLRDRRRSSRRPTLPGRLVPTVLRGNAYACTSSGARLTGHRDPDMHSHGGPWERDGTEDRGNDVEHVPQGIKIRICIPTEDRGNETQHRTVGTRAEKSRSLR